MSASDSVAIHHADNLPVSLVRTLVVSIVIVHLIMIWAILQHKESTGTIWAQSPVFISMIPGGQGGTSMAESTSVNKNLPLAAKKAEPQKTAQAEKIITKEKVIAAQKASETSTEYVKSSSAENAKSKQAESTGTSSPQTTASQSESTGNAHTPGGTSAGYGGSKQAGGHPKSIAFSQLSYRRAIKPEYPARSRERYETGGVAIRVVVDTDGNVKEAQISQSSGYERLDETALRAAKRSSFYPYKENGIPRVATAIIPYNFNLTNAPGSRR